MNKLNEILRTEAIAMGLCEQWQSDWMANKSSGELIEMYKRGIDFCFNREWPSCDWIVMNFDSSELQDKNVFIRMSGGEIALFNGVGVIRECSDVAITIPRNSVVTLHCQRNSRLRIKLQKRAIAFIHLHDSTTEIDATETMANAKIYRYNQEDEVITNGNVVLKDVSM